ncbi:MAG: NBR1-Ig-like domain-containing protein [Anaerolineales bacterium]|jgi:hypothetical protein
MRTFLNSPVISRFLMLATSGLLAACNLQAAPSPTSAQPATSAASTVQAILTEASRGTVPPEFATSTPQPTASPTPQPTVPSPTPASCTDKAAFVDDVTIRDNTELDGGESFVKTWRLQNVGTCVWSTAYNLVFIGGTRMGAPSLVPLPTHVNPQGTVDLAVDMIAPSTSGTYQGFWKLTNAKGDYFGIGPAGDQSFWVKIVVPSPDAGTATATKSATSSISPTPSSTSEASSTPTASATPSATPSATDSPTPSATPTEASTP